MLGRTSSFLDCFCLLVLTEDPPPASLSSTDLACVSTDRGIPEAGLFVNEGIAPRPLARDGVPLMVPVVDILTSSAVLQFCSEGEYIPSTADP